MNRPSLWHVLTAYAPWVRELGPVGWGVLGFIGGGVLAWIAWGLAG